MYDKSGSEKRILVPEVVSKGSNRSPDECFDDFLTVLGDSEQRKEQAKKEKLQRKYDRWAFHFNLLKEQFKDVWDTFGKIEKTCHGWHRDVPGSKRWEFMGVSGYGYNFGAEIYYDGESRSSYFGSRHKKLEVSYGCYPLKDFTKKKEDLQSFILHYMGGYASIPNGIGDERHVGRDCGDYELGENLIGLENCTKQTLGQQLAGVDHMLELLLNEHALVMTLKNDNIGVDDTNLVAIDALYGASLKAVCQMLFVALNKDEDLNLQKYLPEPQN